MLDLSSISNFFQSIYNGILTIVSFVSDGIETVIYAVKTIFALFGSLF